MYKFFSPKEWHKKTVKFLHNQKEHQGNHLKNEYFISTKRTQKQITSPQHLKKKLLWDIYIYIYIYKRSELEDFNLVLKNVNNLILYINSSMINCLVQNPFIKKSLVQNPPNCTLFRFAHPHPTPNPYIYTHTHPLGLRQKSKNFFSFLNNIVVADLQAL